MTKDDLLANIRRDHEALEDVVARLTDAQLSVVGPDRGWSVKDHLSHIAAWERMNVAHLRDGTDHEVAGMDATAFAAATLDELNDRLYSQHRDHTAAEVRDEFAAAHEALVAFLSEMPEGRLTQPYWDDFAPERTALEKIVGDTYLHYREHAEWIGELTSRGAEAP